MVVAVAVSGLLRQRSDQTGQDRVGGGIGGTFHSAIGLAQQLDLQARDDLLGTRIHLAARFLQHLQQGVLGRSQVVPLGVLALGLDDEPVTIGEL